MRFHTVISLAVFVSVLALAFQSSQAQSQSASPAPAPAAATAQQSQRQPAAASASVKSTPATSAPAATPSAAASKSPAAPLPNAKPAKVWTNDDVDVLRTNHGVSVVGSHAPQKVSATSATKGIPQEKDPAWYRKQMQPLQAEIEKLDGQIDKLQKFLSGENISDPPTAHRQMSPTPQEQLTQLEDKRAKDVEKVNDLYDRARHNDIPPGALR